MGVGRRAFPFRVDMSQSRYSGEHLVQTACIWACRGFWWSLSSREAGIFSFYSRACDQPGSPVSPTPRGPQPVCSPRWLWVTWFSCCLSFLHSAEAGSCLALPGTPSWRLLCQAPRCSQPTLPAPFSRILYPLIFAWVDPLQSNYITSSETPYLAFCSKESSGYPSLYHPKSIFRRHFITNLLIDQFVYHSSLPDEILSGK